MSVNFAKLSILQCTCLLAFGLVFIYLRKRNRKSKLNLLSLPNELLVSIFDRIPSHDLVCHLPLTCSQLKRLSKVSCHRRRSLTLVFGQKEFFGMLIDAPVKSSFESTCKKARSDVFALKFPEIARLDQETITRIVLQFPNVCSLQLSICRLTAVQLDLFINESLLRLYTHQLKTLYLVLIFEQENYFRARLSGDLRPLSRALQRTIGVINGMRNLHQLALYSHYNLTQLDLPIIGQLDEFYLQCEKSTDLLFDSLVKYGENERLQQIGLLTTSYLDDLLLTKIFSDAIDTQSLALGITYLKLADFPKLPLDRLNNLLLKLPNLCALSLCWSRAKPFASLVKTLEPFTSANSILKSLHLSILGFPVPDTPQMDLSQWISNGNLPLYSIRSFSLLYDTYSQGCTSI